MHLQSMNLDDAERTLRMAVGWTAWIVGLILVAAGGNATRISAGAILSMTGTAVFLTGYLGRCPVYRRLGRNHRSLRPADQGLGSAARTADASSPRSFTGSRSLGRERVHADEHGTTRVATLRRPPSALGPPSAPRRRRIGAASDVSAHTGAHAGADSSAVSRGCESAARVPAPGR